MRKPLLPKISTFPQISTFPIIIISTPFWPHENVLIMSEHSIKFIKIIIIYEIDIFCRIFIFAKTGDNNVWRLMFCRCFWLVGTFNTAMSIINIPIESANTKMAVSRICGSVFSFKFWPSTLFFIFSLVKLAQVPEVNDHFYVLIFHWSILIRIKSA